MTQFNLKLGMNDKTLWEEIDKVGISGETRQEVISFKKPNKNHEQQLERPLHDVIMCNHTYGIIRKVTTQVDQFHFLIETPEYFWCGINDEGTYFIRPLKELPVLDKLTIENIVAWVNRYDEGFSGRVQGDVLIKFIKKPKIEIKQQQSNINTPNVTQNIQSLTNPNFFAQSLFGRSRRQNNNSNIELLDTTFRNIFDKPVKLGNHKLWVEGQVYVSETMPYILVDAESLILQHEEHQIKETLIPKDTYAILAPQRGRDFNLQELLKKAFD